MSAFNQLKAKLAAQGASSPGGLAAFIGRNKAKRLGQPGAFNEAARKGESMKAVLRSRARGK